MRVMMLSPSVRSRTRSRVSLICGRHIPDTAIHGAIGRTMNATIGAMKRAKSALESRAVKEVKARQIALKPRVTVQSASRSCLRMSRALRFHSRSQARAAVRSAGTRMHMVLSRFREIWKPAEGTVWRRKPRDIRSPAIDFFSVGNGRADDRG